MPEKLRALVRERKEQGADLIKIFASKSVREGGGQTLTDAQLQAACGEASALRLSAKAGLSTSSRTPLSSATTSSGVGARRHQRY